MFDIIVLVVVGILAFSGLWRGVARQVVGIAGIAAGYVVATRLYRPLSAKFLSSFRPATGHVIGFLAVFFACVITASIIGWIARIRRGAPGPGILSRIGGAILGAAKGCLVVSIMVVMIVAFLPSHGGLFKGSRTMKYLRPMAGIVSKLAPKNIRARYDKKSARMVRLPDEGDLRLLQGRLSHQEMKFTL
jgi:membrane protein required for colicin V production